MKRRCALRAIGAASPLGALPWLAAPARGQAAASYDERDLAHAAQLRDRALGDTHAWRLLESLCTEVGARPAGSEADARAIAWAQRELRALRLQNVRAEAFPLRVWQRGTIDAQLLTPQPRALTALALGNSVATPTGGVEGELAIYPTLQALKEDASGRARGRIVFIDQSTEASRDGRGYGATFGMRFGAASAAARQGALAVLIRSLGTSGEAVAHTGAMAYEPGVPRIAAAAVSIPDADHIARLHGQGQTLTARLALQSREGVEASSANVIAEVPGGELRDEIVLIGAHLDSWDQGQGAQDDGAGVAIVSAAAGLIRAAGLPPRRTIRVVLFGNEENGFDGARTYGDRYAAVTHQLVGESDFGAGGVYRLRSRVTPETWPFIEAMGRTLAPLGVATPAQAEGNRGSPGPDAAMLMRRHRWPAIDLAQDGTRYFDVHHSARDTLAQVDATALRQNVACWAVVAWLAAQAPVGFGPATL